MIKLSNSKLTKIITNLLILLVIAKAISLAFLWYLPTDGVELSLRENYQPKYQRIDFKNMIDIVNIKTINKPKDKVDNGISITSMILKALYGTHTKGFVIIAMKSTPKKTSIISIGESFQGYTLKSISVNSAMFTKDGLDFVLSLEKVKNISSITKVQSTSDIQMHSAVSRKDIEYYSKNPQEIWKEISLKELRDANGIIGFKVIRVNENSKFGSLGLKKNDLIVKANNVKLKSYKDALDIYKNIDKLDAIQIVVMRDNKEVELVYEID